MRVSKSVLLAGTVLGMSVAAAPALAQEAAPDQASAGQQGGVQEIVVTARKRQESVQDVPVAVSAISAADIVNRDVTSVEKIAAIPRPDRNDVGSRDLASAHFNKEVARIIKDAGIYQTKPIAWSGKWSVSLDTIVCNIDYI